MLKQALNMLTRIHSRPATLKRNGTPNSYSPLRITPSNYFRFVEGPSQMVIRGREFIIPLDTIRGTAQKLVSFEDEPSAGTFTFTYDSDTSAPINFDDDSAAVQVAMRALDGLENVIVSGDFATGFIVAMVGVQEILALTVTPDMDFDAEITVGDHDYEPWETTLKRGDKIIDSVHGQMAIDEIIEMPDVGGAIMAFRIRCE